MLPVWSNRPSLFPPELALHGAPANHFAVSDKFPLQPITANVFKKLFRILNFSSHPR
jgi:hypothetical protein